MKPNLFDFATSELSQDAFLCWLLSWAKPEHNGVKSKLTEVGRELLSLLYSKAKHPMPEELTSLVIQKQASSIDILCIVNSDSAIIIEDKVGTQQHSNQLAIYRDRITSQFGFPPDKVIALYLQTGDQSDYAEVLKENYSVLSRAELLSVLEGDAAKVAREESDILDCFAVHLRKVEDDVQSYLCTPLNEWSWNAWKGFYTCVQTSLGEGTWNYVPNASGGFLGFWWYGKSNGIGEVYLQMEQERFCFKIVPDSEGERVKLGNEWSALIINHCVGQGLHAVRPSRIRSGEYMTVAVLAHEYRKVNADGHIDINATLEVFRSAQRVIDDCITATQTLTSKVSV